MMNAPAERTQRRVGSRAFTLVELIVVIGVTSILITLTVIAVGAIAKDAKLASGKNRVSAALGTARALAIENQRPTGVVFIVEWERGDPDTPQVTEALVVEWSGETLQPFGSSNPDFIVNKFQPVRNLEPTFLPEGIKVAGPWYNLDGNDEVWVSQPQFPNADPSLNATPEAPGRQLGVLFDTDGSVITAVPGSDSTQRFVDLNSDGTQNVNGNGFYEYNEIEDENNLLWAPFIAVYDDEQAREYFDDSNWTNEAQRNTELTNYINQFADRIHFNRYTGVAMK